MGGTRLPSLPVTSVRYDLDDGTGIGRASIVFFSPSAGALAGSASLTVVLSNGETAQAAAGSLALIAPPVGPAIVARLSPSTSLLSSGGDSVTLVLLVRLRCPICFCGGEWRAALPCQPLGVCPWVALPPLLGRRSSASAPSLSPPLSLLSLSLFSLSLSLSFFAFFSLKSCHSLFCICSPTHVHSHTHSCSLTHLLTHIHTRKPPPDVLLFTHASLLTSPTLLFTHASLLTSPTLYFTHASLLTSLHACTLFTHVSFAFLFPPLPLT